jgi:pyruvyl transferase EpsO
MFEAKTILGAPRTAIEARNAPIVARLQQALRQAMRDCVAPSQDYALVDFPQHANIGDSAIYVGEAILCREHFGRAPRLVTEAFPADVERIARLPANVPVLLHGGGNFGDLYPRHQQFRDAVLERCRDRKIVLLPQSIHFDDERNAAPTARAIAAHPDFTMMVRDHASLAIARRLFDCPVLLVPDMAFMIGLVSPAPADLRVFGLMREDKEAVGSDRAALAGLPSPHLIADWPSEWRPMRRIDRLPRAVRRFLPADMQGWRPVSPAGYEALARRRLATGLAMLARGETVLTDRLHAHILSFLLCRPHVILDNSYRKIGNFVDAWMAGGGFVQQTDLAAAVDLIRQADATRD